MCKLISISIAVAALIYGSATFSNEGNKLYFIDAHSQVDQNITIVINGVRLRLFFRNKRGR